MQVNLKNNIIFGQTSKKENPFDSPRFKEQFPDAPNTDFAAALSAGATILSITETSAVGKIKLKKVPQFLIGMAVITDCGAHLDSIVGNQIKQKYNYNEEKGKKVQLGYDVGISALMFPASLDLIDRTNTYKLKFLDPQYLKECGFSHLQMLGVFAGVGALIGAGVAIYGKKINSWIAQNFMGYKKEEK